MHNTTTRQCCCVVLSFGKYLDLFDERVKQMYSIAVYYMTADGIAVAMMVLVCALIKYKSHTLLYESLSFHFPFLLWIFCTIMHDVHSPVLAHDIYRMVFLIHFLSVSSSVFRSLFSHSKFCSIK